MENREHVRKKRVRWDHGKRIKELWRRILCTRPLTSTCLVVQLSKFTLLTNEMCTPSARWMPEQSIHINTPKLAEAHRGPLLQQSTHRSLPGCLSNFSSLLRSLAWSSPIAIQSDLGSRLVPNIHRAWGNIFRVQEAQLVRFAGFDVRILFSYLYIYTIYMV